MARGGKNPHVHVHGDTKELADEVAERMVAMLEQAPTVKRIRNSQILSVLVGAIGFALFASGIEELTSGISPLASVLFGFLFMAASGALLRNLMR